MIAGVIVIYLTVGSQVTLGFQGIDFGWLGNFSSETENSESIFRATLGSIMAVVIRPLRDLFRGTGKAKRKICLSENRLDVA